MTQEKVGTWFERTYSYEINYYLIINNLQNLF